MWRREKHSLLKILISTFIILMEIKIFNYDKNLMDYQIQYKYLNKIKVNHYVPDISFLDI